MEDFHLKHSDEDIENSLKEFIIRRDKFLSQPYNEQATRDFFAANGSKWKPSSSAVVEAAFHKARTAVSALDIKLRKESKKWLTEHGLQSEDDGELNEE